MTTSAINYQNLSKSLNILRALAHPIRMSILSLIDENKVINVNKIYRSLHLEQSITSQHLRILRTANLVNTKRDGKFIFYTINYGTIKRVVNSTANFFK